MKILVWVLKFQDKRGVGARRWRKLSYYLAKQGHSMTVVAADEPRNAQSGVEGVKLIGCRSKISSIVERAILAQKISRTLWSKSRRAVSRAIGQIDLFESRVKRTVGIVQNELRHRDYDVVVATGHPTSLNLWAAILCTEFPDVMLVQDLRDTWNDERPYSLGPKSLSKKSKERSVMAEQLSLQRADLVLSVSPAQAARISRSCRQVSQNTMVLPNGYDPELSLVRCRQRARGSITVVHAGSIRWQAKQALPALVAALRILDQATRNTFQFVFLGANPFGLLGNQDRRFFLRYASHSAEVGEQQLYRYLRNADVGIVLFEKTAGTSTKVFDYMACDLPVLAIAPEGELRTYLDSVGLPSAGPAANNIASALRSIRDLVEDGWHWGAVRDDFRFDTIAERLSERLSRVRDQIRATEE